MIGNGNVVICDEKEKTRMDTKRNRRDMIKNETEPIGAEANRLEKEPNRFETCRTEMEKTLRR